MMACMWRFQCSAIAMESDQIAVMLVWEKKKEDGTYKGGLQIPKVGT